MTAAAAYSAPLITFGPRVRKSPFFEATRRYGCRAYSVYNHMYMPLFFEDPVTDFWHLVEGVTLWDVACERQVEISGPDAAQFVQLLTPRNLSKFAAGQCKYGLITNHQGSVINDPILLRLADDRFWLSVADSDILLWAQGVAWHSNLRVEITEPDVSPLQIQGPKSRQLMRKLCGGWIDELRYYWFRETDINGMPVVVSRTGWSGELGYEIFLRDGNSGDDLWEYIMASGAEFEIVPGAPSMIRRVEAGMLSYGGDMRGNANPYELGLDRLVDLNQITNFIGKSALQGIHAQGITRKLCGLQIHGEPITSNEQHWPIHGATGHVGHVTSAVYSPRLKKNIALAIVDLEHTATGTELSIDIGPTNSLANVVKYPFYDPKHELVRGS